MISPQDAICLTPPSTWRVVPFWSLFRRTKSIGHADEELLSVYRDHGVVPTSSRDDNHNKPSEDLSGYQLVTEGALVTNKMKAWQGSIAISRHRGIVSPAYYVYQPLSEEYDQFLHYLLRSEPYVALYQRISKGVRVSQWDLEHEALRTIPVLLPDLATQKQIADFLDAETTRIDALIEKKQRLMAVANERIAAIVETAIPSDGPQTKLGHHIDILSGYAFASDGFSSDPEDMRLLRGANVTPNVIRWDDVVYWPRNDVARLARFELTIGDIVLGMDRPWVADGIRVAELREQDTPALLLQRVCKVSARASLNAGYLKLLLTSRRFLAYFEPIMTGVSVPHISPDQVRNFRFGYMPLDEQVQISNRIELARKQVSKVVELAEASIDRLREYRAVLITAAVTGQIDVAARARPMEIAPPCSSAEVVPLRPVTLPDRRTLRVLVASEVVHRLRADPYLGRTKLQKLIFLAEAHANINDIAGRYQRYRYGPYDDAMVQEVELGLRQHGYYDTREGVDREKVVFQRMPSAGDHRDALSVALGDKLVGLRGMVDLFKDMNTEATEAVVTLYAVWNDALIDGQQPDDAAIIRGFLQDWHPEKGKFRQDDLQTWLGWMRRHGIIPHGSGPRTVSTSTPGLFERD
jgi:type I restriction enzyme S subunit